MCLRSSTDSFVARRGRVQSRKEKTLRLKKKKEWFQKTLSEAFDVRPNGLDAGLDLRRRADGRSPALCRHSFGVVSADLRRRAHWRRCHPTPARQRPAFFDTGPQFVCKSFYDEEEIFKKTTIATGPNGGKSENKRLSHLRMYAEGGKEVDGDIGERWGMEGLAKYSFGRVCRLCKW